MKFFFLPNFGWSFCISQRGWKQSVKGKTKLIFNSDLQLLSQPLSSDSNNMTADQIRENDVRSAGTSTLFSAFMGMWLFVLSWAEVLRQVVYPEESPRHGKLRNETTLCYALEQSLEEVAVVEDICFVVISILSPQFALKGMSAVWFDPLRIKSESAMAFDSEFIVFISYGSSMAGKKNWE